MSLWLRFNDHFINLALSTEIWFTPENYNGSGERKVAMNIKSLTGTIKKVFKEEDYKEFVRCLHIETNPFITIKEEA